MSMHQMKRAEVSGWKHYTMVILNSHTRESLIEFFWGLVEERYDSKRTQSQDKIYWFSYQPQRICHAYPHFAFSLLHRGSRGSDTFPPLQIPHPPQPRPPCSPQSWLLSFPAASRKPGHLLPTHCACLPGAKSILGPLRVVLGPVATALCMFIGSYS